MSHFIIVIITLLLLLLLHFIIIIIIILLYYYSWCVCIYKPSCDCNCSVSVSLSKNLLEKRKGCFWKFRPNVEKFNGGGILEDPEQERFFLQCLWHDPPSPGQSSLKSEGKIREKRSREEFLIIHTLSKRKYFSS